MRSSEVADEHILNKWHVNKMGGNKQVHYSVSVSVKKTCACTERFRYMHFALFHAGPNE